MAGGYKESKTLSERRLIAVALPLLSESEIILVQAIREELARRGDFEVMVLSGGFESLLRKIAENGEVAGVIGDFMSGVWLKSLLDHGIKVVGIGDGMTGGMGAGTSWVTTDVRMMGSEAARLLGNGVRALAYLGPTGAPGSIRLGEAFAAACAESGREVSRCHSATGVLLRNFLRSLAKPCGLLCANDQLARRAISAAGEEGLRVPQDLAVMGVGNVRMESLHAGMPISSFELPQGEVGRLAAAAMVALLDGQASSQETVAPLVHERESSMRSPSGVARAMAYLRSHPGTSKTAGELAILAGMSRRSFEKALRQAEGLTPGALLKQIRRKRAEELLRETTLGIGLVGRECGYDELAVFSAAFKRWTGRSPREFREDTR
jgi:LacI family transcriptional regulator